MCCKEHKSQTAACTQGKKHTKNMHVCMHAQGCAHTQCIVNSQTLHSQASRGTNLVDGCLETGSSKALNAVFFFQILSNSFNLQHLALAFTFALDAGKYVEQCKT